MEISVSSSNPLEVGPLWRLLELAAAVDLPHTHIYKTYAQIHTHRHTHTHTHIYVYTQNLLTNTGMHSNIQ